MSESESSASRPTRAFQELPSLGDERLDGLARLLAIVDRLREPDGCPWDLEQSVESMAPSLTEEAFEALEAIETGSDREVAEELGDLTLVIALIARIAGEARRFDMGSIAQAVGDKLIRRHPHVFGEAEAASSEHVVQNWERIKQAERAEREEDTSALAGVPASLPALQRIDRLGAKAISAGFRWSDSVGALEKLREEVSELQAELAKPEVDQARVAAELGDVLMAGALLGRYLKLDPEQAAREAARRFEARFRCMEEQFTEGLGQASLEEMLTAWQQAKAKTEA